METEGTKQENGKRRQPQRKECFWSRKADALGIVSMLKHP
jgi:hypothetical protein